MSDVVMSAELTRLQDVRVSATAALPATAVAVGRLAELEPGQLLRLGLRSDSRCELVVNGVVLAEGEIVRTGAARGLRVEVVR